MIGGTEPTIGQNGETSGQHRGEGLNVNGLDQFSLEFIAFCQLKQSWKLGPDMEDGQNS